MRFALTALVLMLTPALVWAESLPSTEPRWLFVTRFVLSGTSDTSDPEGITIYSGLGLEGAIRRTLGHHLRAELSLRTESREVDREIGAEAAEPLGSLEVLPMTLALQYDPEVGGRFHPYAGAGVNLTVVWEKSGFLDTYDVEPHVGPAVQLGVDVALGASAVLNLDVRWNTLTAEIVRDGEDFARVKIDPLALGLGVGFPF